VLSTDRVLTAYKPAPTTMSASRKRKQDKVKLGVIGSDKCTKDKEEDKEKDMGIGLGTVSGSRSTAMRSLLAYNHCSPHPFTTPHVVAGKIALPCEWTNGATVKFSPLCRTPDASSSLSFYNSQENFEKNRPFQKFWGKVSADFNPRSL